jgi:hypothetical protein
LAVITVGDSHHAACIAVTAHVSLERIAAAEQIAAKYNQKMIVCCVGDKTWTECVEEDHATQVQHNLQCYNSSIVFMLWHKQGQVIALAGSLLL